MRGRGPTAVKVSSEVGIISLPRVSLGLSLIHCCAARFSVVVLVGLAALTMTVSVLGQ